MNMTAKRLGKCLLALLIAFMFSSTLLVGCLATGQKADLESSAKLKTVTVVDCIGRKVQVPAKVRRIGCLYAFSGHVVAMLGKEKNIVAVVAGLKRDKLLTQMYPSISKASVPFQDGSINIEELMKADPDLVFIQSETAKNKGEAEKLQEAGIPYLVIDYKTMKEQQYAIRMIGQAIGAEAKAKEYNQYYQQCIDTVEKRVADIPVNQRVRVYHSVNEATRTDSKDTLPADWIQAAGGVDVSVDKRLKLFENKYYAGLEQIYLWDPAVIIANEDGVANYIMTNKQWSGLKAVKQHRVYQMPNGISRWGHPGSMETPLGLLWTAKTLYPERFTDIDMRAETKEFYRHFFDYNLSEQMVSQILSGEGMRMPKQQ